MKSTNEDNGNEGDKKEISINPSNGKTSTSIVSDSSSPDTKDRKNVQKRYRSRSVSSSPSPIRRSKRKRSRTVSRSQSPKYYRRSSPSTRSINENSCLGVFGMSLDTTEKTLEKEFEKFGRLRKVKVVRNLGSGTSRGFAFVYFDDPEDARSARNEMNGRKEIDGHTIRIDYSVGRRERAPRYRGYYYERSCYSPCRERYERHRGSENHGYHGRSRRSHSPYERRRQRSRSRSRH